MRARLRSATARALTHEMDTRAHSTCRGRRCVEKARMRTKLERVPSAAAFPDRSRSAPYGSGRDVGGTNLQSNHSFLSALPACGTAGAMEYKQIDMQTVPAPRTAADSVKGRGQRHRRATHERRTHQNTPHDYRPTTLHKPLGAPRCLCPRSTKRECVHDSAIVPNSSDGGDFCSRVYEMSVVKTVEAHVVYACTPSEPTHHRGGGLKRIGAGPAHRD